MQNLLKLTDFHEVALLGLLKTFPESKRLFYIDVLGLSLPKRKFAKWFKEGEL